MKIEDTLNNYHNWGKDALVYELAEKVKELIAANNQKCGSEFAHCEKCVYRSACNDDGVCHLNKKK